MQFILQHTPRNAVSHSLILTHCNQAVQPAYNGKSSNVRFAPKAVIH